LADDKKAAPLAPANVALAATDDVNLTNRERYYNYIKTNFDEYTSVTYTAEEKRRIESHLRKLSTGASAMIPLFCSGPACPFAARCVYQQMGKAPIGKACLVESQLLQHWIITYMEEYQVDPDSFTEVGYCNELAEIEVMLYRLNQLLSRPENADGTLDQTVGVGNDGTPIVQKVISPWMEQKEKLLTRRSRIIKLMVGDRQEKYKKEAALKVRESKDPSQKMADVRRQIELLQRNLNTIEQKALPPPGAEDTDQSFTPTKSEKIKELEAVLTPDQLIGAD
jgi:hypothetical protein